MVEPYYTSESELCRFGNHSFDLEYHDLLFRARRYAVVRGELVLRSDVNDPQRDLIENYKKIHGYYPEVLLGDQIYGTRKNRKLLKEKGIRFGGKPLGRPKKQTQENSKEIKEAKNNNKKIIGTGL